MGIVHHANYIVWFEIGRTDLCRATGFTYREIETRGLIMVVTEVNCRYRAPYHYDDDVLIRTFVTEAGSRAMTFRSEPCTFTTVGMPSIRPSITVATPSG